MMPGVSSAAKLTTTLFFLSAVTGAFYSFSQGSEGSGLISPVILGGAPLKEEKKTKNAFSFLNNFFAPRGVEKRSGLGFILGEKTTQPPENSSPFAPRDSTVPTIAPDPQVNESFMTPTPTPLSSSPSPASTSTAVLTPEALSPSQIAVKTAAGSVIDLLISRDFRKLYTDLMSAEFKELFPLDDFVSRFESSVDVASGQLSSSPVVYEDGSEWASQTGKLVLNDGTQKNYLLIFRQENGSWKLSGTEDK